MVNSTITPIAPTGEEAAAFAEALRLALEAFNRRFSETGEYPFYYYEILYALYRINALSSLAVVEPITKFGAKEIDTLNKLYSKPEAEEIRYFQQYNRVAAKVYSFMQSVCTNLSAKNIIK